MIILKPDPIVGKGYGAPPPQTNFRFFSLARGAAICNAVFTKYLHTWRYLVNTALQIANFCYSQNGRAMLLCGLSVKRSVTRIVMSIVYL